MVDYKYSELYKQESIDKQMNIAFDGGNITNDDIHSEQFELTESLCSESELRFGSCESSMIKFRISNIFTPLKDKWLTVTETLNHNTDIPFQFGKYKVYSDTPTADRRYRDVVAYDKMYDIINTDLTDWYNSIFATDDTEVTLKEFRDRLMNYLGVEQEDVTLVNDDMIIRKTIQPTQLSGRYVISAICEINGCFGHIGRDGKFHYVFLPKYAQGLYPSNNLYPSNDLYPRDSSANKIDTSLYIDCKYEDYISQRITKLQIRQEENDIGAIYPGGISTESDNTYIIQDNFLVYGKSASELEEIAGNLFEIIEDTEYRPFNAKVVGNPCFEVGDAIRFNTKYQIVESYVLNRTLKGVQRLRDSFSADGKEYYSEKVNAIETQINQLKGKTNTLERNVEETRSEIKDVEKGLQSEIRQTADIITSTVASAQSKWDDSAYVNAGYTPEYGCGEPTSTPSSSNQYYLDVTSGWIYKGSRASAGYEWVKHEQLKKVKDVLSSEIDQTAESITSTVASAQSKWDTTGYTIDFYGYGFPSISAEENPLKIYLDQSTGKLYKPKKTSVENPFFWYNFASLELITDELSSQIEQAVGSIVLKVDANGRIVEVALTGDPKDGTTFTVLADNISLSASEVIDMLTNGDINLTGKNITITSDNFNVDSDGNMSCKNATVNGDITAQTLWVNEKITMMAGEEVANMIRMAYSSMAGPSLLLGFDSLPYAYMNTDVFQVRGELYCGGPIYWGSNNVLYSINNATHGTIQYFTLTESKAKGVYIHVQTSLTAYGITIWASDTKLKKNINPTEETALDKINQIEFIQFDWKSNDSHVDLGVSANQLEDVIPQAVYDVEQSEESEYDSLKNVDNGVMTTYALKAIQEQQEIIENQQKEIDELKKSVSFLMQKTGGAYNE